MVANNNKIENRNVSYPIENIHDLVPPLEFPAHHLFVGVCVCVVRTNKIENCQIHPCVVEINMQYIEPIKK